MREIRWGQVLKGPLQDFEERLSDLFPLLTRKNIAKAKFLNHLATHTTNSRMT